MGVSHHNIITKGANLLYVIFTPWSVIPLRCQRRSVCSRASVRGSIPRIAGRIVSRDVTVPTDTAVTTGGIPAKERL